MSIKIFIVDDEEIIREGLSSLDWAGLGLEFVGNAENGEAAYEKIKELAPDIIISDIKMPKKDGIWLAEQIKELSPNTKIVFLSGHNDFEYAQKAIKFDVYEYVLKPIDEEVLFDLVTSIKNKITEERKDQEEAEKFRSTVGESRYFLKSWFLNNLTDSNSKLEFFGFPHVLSKYSTIVVKFNSADTPEFENVNTFILFNKILNLLQTNNYIFAPFFDGSLLTYIFQWDYSLETNDIEKKMFKIGEILKEFLDNNGLSYTIGIGFIVDKVSDILSGYKSAYDTLTHSFHLGQNQIIYICDVEPLNNNIDTKIKITDDYINAIKICDEEGLSNILTNYFSTLSKANEAMNNVKRICLELIVYTSRAIYETGQNPDMLFKKTDLWSVINKCETIEELYNLILGINKVVISQIQEIRTNRNDDIILKVKEIVNANYAKGVSLDSLAEQVFLSPCYLSVIFSKETNMNFKDYLILTRMNKAKELLSKTDLKVYEIAQEVGYADPRYFSDLFKRTTGKTPVQFRGSN